LNECEVSRDVTRRHSDTREFQRNKIITAALSGKAAARNPIEALAESAGAARKRVAAINTSNDDNRSLPPAGPNLISICSAR
jgi:hypothetical protein